MRASFGFAFFFISLSAAIAGCPSADDTTADDTDAAPPAEAALYDVDPICDNFTSNGKPCAPAGPHVCFPLCAIGGCRCVNGAGGAIWFCTIDTSCIPDAPPGNDPDVTQGDDAGEDVATQPDSAPVDAGVDSAPGDAVSDVVVSDAVVDGGDQ